MYRTNDLLVFVPAGHSVSPAKIAAGITTQRVYTTDVFSKGGLGDSGTLCVHIFEYTKPEHVQHFSSGFITFQNVLMIVNQDIVQGNRFTNEVEYNDMLNEKFPNGRHTILSVCKLHTNYTEQSETPFRMHIIRTDGHDESEVINDIARQCLDRKRETWTVHHSAGTLVYTIVVHFAVDPKGR
jgi:hypothetical protein